MMKKTGLGPPSLAFNILFPLEYKYMEAGSNVFVTLTGFQALYDHFSYTTL